MPALVPELSVRDWRISRAFYRDVLGFEVRYQRPEEGFAYLALGDAELMIDEIGTGRDFHDHERGDRLGIGVNLQIAVPALAPFLAALDRSGTRLLLLPEERWYRRGSAHVGVRQVVVADPDGYLLRLYEDLGTRPPAE